MLVTTDTVKKALLLMIGNGAVVLHFTNHSVQSRFKRMELHFTFVAELHIKVNEKTKLGHNTITV